MKNIIRVLLGLWVISSIGCAFHFPLPTKSVAFKPMPAVPAGLKTQTEIKHEHGMALDKFIRHYDPAGHLIKITRFEIMGGNPPAERLYGETGFSYDADGHLIKKIDYNETYGEEVKRIFRYDARGNKVEEMVYDAADKLAFKVIAEYDEVNRLIKSTSYVPDEEVKVLVANRYNEQGQLVSQVTSDTRTVYKYDEKGKKTGEEVYNLKDEHLIRKSVYIYTRTKTGSLVEESVYDDDKRLLEEWLYEYDKRGRKTRQGGKDYGLIDKKKTGEEKPSGEGYWIYWTYKYNRQGYLAQEKKYAETPAYEFHYLGIYKYDKRGNLVDHARYASELGDERDIFEQTTYEYEVYP